MTDESVLRWVHEVLQCGSLNERKKRPNLRDSGDQMRIQS